MADKFEITVLPDGSLKIETDRISMPNHTSAERFFQEVLTAMGGKVDRKSKKHLHHEHSHHHHEHDKGG
jgi:hypothetical protein